MGGVPAEYRTPGVVLRHADLREASLKGANFSLTNPRGLLVRSTPACDPNCQKTNLAYANLAGADLTDANFTGTQLAYANLTGANLTDANLTDANLAYANLTGADLSGTILSNTQLYCATMPDGKINNNGC